MRQARSQQSAAFHCHIYIKSRGLLGVKAQQSADYVNKIDINLAVKPADCWGKAPTVREIQELGITQIF